MPNTPKLAPEQQFPQEAILESIISQPPVMESPAQGGTMTIFLATSADNITPWGRNVERRDKELREFWPTEPYLAGAVANVSFRNAAFDWEIESDSDRVAQAVTDMLKTAIAGDKIGWEDFVKRFSADLYTQDNGAFIELIRDPSMDATSRFKGPMAPVIGIAHLDANRCIRTGNIKTPVLYKDRDERLHKLNWYDVITFSDFPSPIEKMNGVGYCSVTRALRLSQIMRSLLIYKDEKIGGRNPKEMHIVGGVAQKSIEDALLRTKEGANNKGNIRYIENVVLASLDPEKPVSVATVELASLPEGFEFDADMQWYIAGLALNFGVDYQEFAPLPGGNIGSSAQSTVLMRKTSGKGPRNWMDSISESFKNYGVLPRGTEMKFNDKNLQEELEKQETRTKALEEAAIAARSKIFPRKYLAEDLVRRGLYSSIEGIQEEFWKDEQPISGNPIGQRGGNTIREDSARTDSGKTNQTIGDRLRKIFGWQND